MQHYIQQKTWEKNKPFLPVAKCPQSVSGLPTDLPLWAQYLPSPFLSPFFSLLVDSRQLLLFQTTHPGPKGIQGRHDLLKKKKWAEKYIDQTLMVLIK
jgi:hypothetical protein